MSDVHKFAFVGHVNPGKTSVIATLTEDDQLYISTVSGSTTKCRSVAIVIKDETILEFYDTPGFQNAKEVLKKLNDLDQHNDDPLEAFRRFTAKHGANYPHECELFTPIIDGAGIVYVVDASQPIRSANETEMEILRMTGRPRMGLINWTAEPEYKDAWETQLNKHFNLVRTFNAHTASYHDRVAFIKSLAELKESWRPEVLKAVEAIEVAWRKRIEDCAEIISELLINCLQHQKISTYNESESEMLAKEGLIEKYKNSIYQMECCSHHKIVQLFKHAKVAINNSGGQVVSEDIWSEKTWEMLGLNQAQLVVAAAVSGAVAGGVVDLALGGGSFGLGAAIGAATGTTSVLIAGKSVAKIELTLPGRWGRMLGTWKPGGRHMTAGPCKDRNFPWILLDRALTACYYVLHRAHAVQGKVTIDINALLPDMEKKGILTKTWTDVDRKVIASIFGLVLKKKEKPEHRKQLRNFISVRLNKMT